MHVTTQDITTSTVATTNSPKRRCGLSVHELLNHTSTKQPENYQHHQEQQQNQHQHHHEQQEQHLITSTPMCSSSLSTSPCTSLTYSLHCTNDHKPSSSTTSTTTASFSFTPNLTSSLNSQSPPPQPTPPQPTPPQPIQPPSSSSSSQLIRLNPITPIQKPQHHHYTSSSSPSSRGPWRVDEDSLLRSLVDRFGACHWSAIAAYLPGRSGKQARERWINQLNPQLKKKNWTAQEDRTILRMHSQMGNKWSTIAHYLPGRTDNAVKNRFNSTLKRAMRDRVVNENDQIVIGIDEIVHTLHARRQSKSTTKSSAKGHNTVYTSCNPVCSRWEELGEIQNYAIYTSCTDQ